jgi:hypothetical protein
MRNMAIRRYMLCTREALGDHPVDEGRMRMFHEDLAEPDKVHISPADEEEVRLCGWAFLAALLRAQQQRHVREEATGHSTVTAP